MEPMKPAARPQSLDPDRTTLTGSATMTWDEENYWREVREQFPEEVGVAPVPNWRSEDPYDGYPEEELREPAPKQAPDRYGAWWPPEDTGSGSDRHSEATPSNNRLTAPSQPVEEYVGPQIRRRPVEDWPPREPGTPGTWREEQFRREQRLQEDGNTWSGEADSYGSPFPQNPGGLDQPETDWRQEWLR
jgi:hypothetical protein